MNITTEEYLALAACTADKNEPRFTIRGILIEPGGVAVATNGRIMVRLSTGCPVERIEGWLRQTNRSNLIVAPWSMPKSKRDRNHPIWFEFEGKDVIARHGAQRTRLTTIEGTFPKWRRVDAWYKEEWREGQVSSIGVTVSYLANLGSNHVMLTFGKTPRDPIRVECSKPLQNIRGTLLPVVF